MLGEFGVLWVHSSPAEDVNEQFSLILRRTLWALVLKTTPL